MARPRVMPADTRDTARIRNFCSSFRKRRMSRPSGGASSMQLKYGKVAVCSVISATHQEIYPDASQDQNHEQQVVLQKGGLDKGQEAAAADGGEGHRVHPAVHHPPVVGSEPRGEQGRDEGVAEAATAMVPHPL